MQESSPKSESEGEFECKDLRKIPAATRISLRAFKERAGKRVKGTLYKNLRDGTTGKKILFPVS